MFRVVLRLGLVLGSIDNSFIFTVQIRAQPCSMLTDESNVLSFSGTTYRRNQYVL